jgi:alpha-tubulin suppressor-like RCC1 family protein
VGTLGCWGVGDVGQIGDGTTQARTFARSLRLAEGKLTDLALGEHHSCAVFDGHAAYCWGDGGRGQLGVAVPRSLVPVATGDRSDAEMIVRVGRAHTCVRLGHGDRLRCFGADDEGQLGASPPSSPGARASAAWDRGAAIRAVALGDAHTCVAYSRSSADAESVLCRGRAVAAPREPLLSGVAVTALVAGAAHTCALLEDRTVRCWGKNDAGQLGDGTTSDSAVPVSVLDLAGVQEIAAGARHTCAHLSNNTIACWGDNSHHQLANGTTERSTRSSVLVGLVGVKQIAAGGDGTCALLDGGFVRCWGTNDRGQLGDGSSVEHSVPMPIKYR